MKIPAPRMRLFSLIPLASLAALAAPVLASAAPAEYHPVRVLHTEDAVFPLNLSRQGYSSGQADVAAAIDAQGRLTDCLVTSCTRLAFGQAALKAARQWTFAAARLGGEPVPSVLSLHFEFATQGTHFSEDPDANTGGRMTLPSLSEPKPEYHVCALRDLDRPPAALSAEPPAGSSPAGAETVVVSFFIDPQGHVRLPGLTEADDPARARAALDAVGRWRFQPPLRQGQPVTVRVTHAFRFDAPAG